MSSSAVVPDTLSASFRESMRRLATTVSIVTTLGDQGPSGMTATAVTSLTVEPPALLVCVNRQASIHPALRLKAAMCVNLLHEDHRDLSGIFGGRAPPERRFESGQWLHSPDGLPYLTDAQANIFCQVDAMFEYGTHTIVVGKVESVRLHGEVRPLLYGDGRYFGLLGS